MTNLNIKIKINEIDELKPIIEYIQKLELWNYTELNPNIEIELN